MSRSADVWPASTTYCPTMIAFLCASAKRVNGKLCAKEQLTMSLAGARRTKELGEKYAKIMYGAREETTVKLRRRSMFCPRCGSYVPALSKCRKCGFEPEETRATRENDTHTRQGKESEMRGWASSRALGACRKGARKCLQEKEDREQRN